MTDENPYQLVEEKSSKRFSSIFIIEGVFIFFILINLVYLNIAFLQKSKSSQSELATTANISVQNQPQIVDKTPTPLPSLATKPTPTFTPTPSPKPTTAVTTSQTSAVKDYYIPLGSGSGNSGDWADITGAQVKTDFGQYQNVKSIVLEVSLSVPTGNQDVWVRLFNDTDSHPVWFSDITMNGGTSAYLVSSPFTYDKGEKTYQAQMKTQLQYQATVTQARIHITLN